MKISSQVISRSNPTISFLKLEWMPRQFRLLKLSLTTFFAYNLTFLCVASLASDSGSEPPSLESIASAIQESRAGVKSLRLAVRRTQTILDGVPIDPPKFLSEVEFAFSGEQRFLNNEQVQSGTKGQLLVDGEPSEKEQAATQKKYGSQAVVGFKRAYDGEILRTLNGDTVGTLESLQTREEIKGSKFDMYYLRSVGWFILDPMATDDFETLRKTRFLPNIFISQRYSVKKEGIDGIDCVRLDGTVPSDFQEHDTIWLDESHEYMLLRRDFSEPSGRLIYQVKMADPVEITDRLHLPKICIINEYPLSESGLPGGKIAKQIRMELIDWSVNDIPDSLFSFEFPPNAMISDFVDTLERGLPVTQPIHRFTSADGKILDRTVQSLQSGPTLGNVNVSQSRGGLFWGNVIVIVVLFVSLLFLRWKARA